MTISGKRDSVILFLGDVLFFAFSLWLTLVFRYLSLPDKNLLILHFVPFSILFIVWITVFFVAGLYGKHTLVLKSRLPSIIINAQIINIIIAAIFFFMIPFFGIAPKTNLFIYLVISSLLILFWRLYGQEVLSARVKQSAILIGSGDEMRELKEEVNNNSKYNIKFDSFIDLNEVSGLSFKDEILERVYSENISIIVIDLKDEKIEPILPHLYNLLFAKVRFIDLHKVYEDIFDRIPLSLLKDNWFLENISLSPKAFYDFLKRIMDIILSVVVVALSLVLYPIVYILIKLDDNGPILYSQERVGQFNKIIRIYKFRSMTLDESPKDRKITRVGKILRKTRIDEFPQVWSVLRGDQSFIGPRPEIPEYTKEYEKEISYYNVRHLIKPGLSGWAQVHQDTAPKFKIGYDETKIKLSYDLFYVKNRSLLLDVLIFLMTIRTLLSRSGI